MMISGTLSCEALATTLTAFVTPGPIVAEIVVRGRHTLVVDIEFDSMSFDISYKSSINLSYQVREGGTHIIHRNETR